MTHPPTDTPTRIDRHSDREMLIEWTSGDRFTIPYTELRFHCPCASCVDEHTGRRMIQRQAVRDDVRPLKVELIGRYAVQIQWSDRHATGMYPFDLLRTVSEQNGVKL